MNSVPSKDTSPPNKTVSVDTTLSLAVNPVISAVETFQSPKPSGANKGANIPPNNASKLSSAEAATFSLISKVCKNQITREATKIMVNAFFANPFAFSMISCHTLFADGNR